MWKKEKKYKLCLSMAKQKGNNNEKQHRNQNKSPSKVLFKNLKNFLVFKFYCLFYFIFQIPQVVPLVRNP
jgi:hypothetical protein